MSGLANPDTNKYAGALSLGKSPTKWLWWRRKAVSNRTWQRLTLIRYVDQPVSALGMSQNERLGNQINCLLCLLIQYILVKPYWKND